MGMMQTASWAGASVGPMIGGALQFFFGYRLSFVLTAVLMLAGGFLVLFGVRENFTPPADPKRGFGGMFHAWRSVFGTQGVPLAYFLRFAAWLGRTMLVPFLPLFIATITVKQELAGMYTGLAIGLAAASSTLSGVVLGRLSDRVGYKPILVASAVACAVFYVPMAYVTDVLQLVIVNVLIGFGTGGVLPAISAMLAHLTPRGSAGSVYGIDNSVAAASRAVAPIVAGAIVTLTSLPGETNYRTIFLVTAVLFLVTAVVAARGLKPVREVDAARSQR
jgi:DHA1 family multidrug resistance protein-like MFS transporter